MENRTQYFIERCAALGISLADACEQAGITASSAWRWEQGKSEMSKMSARVMAPAIDAVGLQRALEWRDRLSSGPSADLLAKHDAVPTASPIANHESAL